jgi:ketosteroid isomerase-like protein
LPIRGAIERLKAEYFRRLDAKDWDAFAALFTGDCEFVTYCDLANTQVKRRCGADEIAASVQRTVGKAITVHSGELIELTILSADRAQAVWAMTDRAELPEGGAFRRMAGAGRYYEEYRRNGNDWQIARLELKRTALTTE